MTGQAIKSEKPLVSFVDKQYLANYFLGKTVVIVGSAPSVLKNEPGFIDSHDVVVRVNNYKLGSRAGRRTDVHYSFYGTSIKKCRDELMNDGVYLCMCKCPDSKFIESKWHTDNGKENGVDYRWIYQQRKDFWFCRTYVPTTEAYLEYFDLLGKHIPTTGFACILDFLSFPCKSLYITGFDFFASKIHNVNEPWNPGKKNDPIRHVPRQECNWLRNNRKFRRLSFDGTLEALLNV